MHSKYKYHIVHAPVPCPLHSGSHHVLPDFKDSSDLCLGFFLFSLYVLFLEDILQYIISVHIICYHLLNLLLQPRMVPFLLYVHRVSTQLSDRGTVEKHHYGQGHAGSFRGMHETLLAHK